jgi:hypothetical protein
MEDPPKFSDPLIEFGGVRVGIGKACPFIDSVYEV